MAFAYAYFDKSYVPLQVVTTFFFVEFLIRVDGRASSTARSGVVAGALTRSQPPDWVSAKPKRFAWTLGLALSCAMTVITNSGIRGYAAAHDLPRLPDADVDGVGARPVRRLRDPRLLVRRGWAAKDDDIEICADGVCELPSLDAQRADRPGEPTAMSALSPLAPAFDSSRVEPGRAEAAFLDANPSFRETAAARRAARDRVRPPRRRAATSTSTTPAAACTPSRRSRSTCACCATTVYGNPHSVNPTSSAATALVERARAAVLRYFNAPESEYACIFTPNATGALRLVGEAYPFGPRDRFLATFDNHNSVNGIREFARAKGAQTAYVPLEAPDLRVADACSSATSTTRATGGHNLFAYPAQSNFSGVKHPLEWIALAHERGWDVLVDCAAFVPTSRLDLSVCEAGLRPDLVLQDVRLPDRPRRAARAARRRSSGCSARGSAAAPWSPRTSRARWSCRCPATRCSRTARSTTSASRRSRSACATSSGSASTRSRGACEALGTWLLDALQRLRHSDGSPAVARLRADDVGPPRRARSRSTSCTRTAASSTSASSTSSPPRTASPSGPGASATPAPARPRSRSRATR